MTVRASVRARGRTAVAAPVIDAICLCAFVLLGRESHGVDEGAAWFFVVVWPFVVGWYVAAMAFGAYASRTRWARVVATAVAGVAIALVLRVSITHRDAPPAFVAVALGFILLTTVGWRVAVFAVRDRRSRLS